MAKEYRPIPGTNAHKAIRFVSGYSQEWVPGTLIASAIGIASAEVSPYLLAPLKHGYLRKRVVHVGPRRRRLTEWALGPLALEQPKPVQRSVPRGPGSVWDYAGRV